jgi:hypothetical protein
VEDEKKKTQERKERRADVGVEEEKIRIELINCLN